MTGQSVRDRAGLTLTVLGATAPYPGPGQATPGYLVEGFGARVLLDCGSGVVSRLSAYCDPADLDAVVLSHLHFDHCSDVLVLRYALDLAVRAGRLDGPVPLWCPSEPAEVFSLMSYKEALAARPLEPGLTVSAGGMAITFVPVRHSVETYGVAFGPAGAGSARAAPPAPILFYTADTALFDNLPLLAGAPRILLVEASLSEREAARAPVTGHLTAGEAARLGAETGAEHVVLTHYPPGRTASELIAEARRSAACPVTVAVEGLTLTWP
jgi:ribonuclease BN (tRNA processing enzyme)